MMKAKQYRQGDVLIERIERRPAWAKAQEQAGRVILAHGEVTGHAHSFEACDAKRLKSQDGADLFQVTGRPMDFRLPLIRRRRNQVMVGHPELGVIEFAEEDVTIEDEMVIVRGDFGLLEHQEHAVLGIPAGWYRGAGAGGKVRQREYSPEAIRPVGD